MMTHDSEAAPVEIAGRFYRPGLTGVRGIAALWVVLFHAHELAEVPFGLPARETVVGVRSGYLGVDLFFLLSGFVLTLNYLPRLRGSGREGLFAFVRGRITRILPLQWATLLAMLLLTIWLPGYWGPGPFSGTAFVASLLLVQSWAGMALAWNNPAWSLSAEWLAYAVFVVLVRPLAAMSRRPTLVLAFVIVLLPLYLAAYGRHPITFDHAERLGVVRCLCEFTAGAILCRFADGLQLRRGATDAVLLAGFALLLIALGGPLLDGFAPLGFALVILACALDSPLAARVLGNRPAIFLGEISFSLYLVHQILFQAAVNLARGDVAQERILLAVAAVALVPFAWSTWRWIERPGQMLGRRIASR